MEKCGVNIGFRPHHFLCALCFKGKGYSPAFIRNFKTIMQVLQGPDGDSTSINIVKNTDSICAPCPHRQDQLCQTEDKIQVLDSAHTAVLQWETETSISWGNAKQRIATELTFEKFHAMCSTCSWKQYGMCESVLTEFLPSK